MLFGVLIGILLFWCGLGIYSYWSTRKITVLESRQTPEPLLSTPKVSIILSARNEEKALPAALESFLKLDFPDYEVILVDDDSTDRTGAIAEEWARRPESAGRLKVIHNRELPRGWTGKVHALNLAARAARGDWLLATDADVVFHPALLRLALGCAIRQEAQLLSLIPEIELGSFADKAILPAFSLILNAVYPLRRVPDPKFPRAIAAGAFILMRREDLEALGGYESLRTTLIEDVRMAELFKRQGRRISIALTRGLFRTRDYGGWRSIREALKRSAFEGTGFSLRKAVEGFFFGNVLALLPGATVAVRAAHDWRYGQALMGDKVFLLALATCGMSFLVYLPFLLLYRISPLYVFMLPLAFVFYSAVTLDSALTSAFGRGVPWKGRRYRRPG